MIVIEPVEQFGQVSIRRPSAQQQIEIAQRVRERIRESRRQSAAQRKARAERIRQEEQRNIYRQPQTPFEEEAFRRMSEVQERAHAQDVRKRFSAELQRLPLTFKWKVRDLLQAYGRYESLPGYADFAAGRTSIRALMPTWEQAYDALKGQQKAQRAQREAAFEEKHSLIEQEIQIERGIKAQARQAGQEQAMQRKLQASARRRERDRVRAEKKAEQARKKKEADDLAKERRRIASQERVMRARAEMEAHPQQPGSPPVLQAIREIANQYGLAPGEMDSQLLANFRDLVVKRAKQLSRQFYYYKRGSSTKRFYDVKPRTADTILRAEGFVLREAPKPLTVVQPRTAPTPTVRKATPTYTMTPNDPIVHRAIDEAMWEQGLQPGQEIDPVAFERTVRLKANALAQAGEKMARTQDLQAGIRARVRFVLAGLREVSEAS